MLITSTCTQIFEKVSDQSLSTICETTLTHWFYDPENVQNKAKERTKNKEERGEGTKKTATFAFILATLEHEA